MTTTNEKLIKVLFYSPTGATSVNKLYQKLKHRGITRKEIQEFIDKQESHQIFKKPNTKINYFPIYANHKNEIFQIDIIDLSDIETSNNHYKYILACIDVYSRYVYCIPMKNKTTDTIINAINNIFKIAKPEQITCDNGSEFISLQFKKLMKEYNIDVHYVDVGDHHKLAIIDRFVRTLREKINKYLEMHNTTKYIDVLTDLIYSYNNTYHTTLKKSPIEVKNNDGDINNMYLDKYMKAKNNETIYNIGDKVRHLLNRNLFEKKSLAKWSKTIYTIIDKTEHSYKLNNEKFYKYYELQHNTESQSSNKPIAQIKKQPTREAMKIAKTNRMRLRREGLILDNVISKRLRDRK